MIIETIIVTDTPQSLRSLLKTARPNYELPTTMAPVRSIILRSIDDVAVFASEQTTNTPVPLTDPANDQKYATLDSTGFGGVLLNCAAGETATLGLFITT